MRGKAVWNGCRTPSCQDHPRLCGEKGGFPHSRYRELGSPPPMRGKEYGNLLVLPGDGITPAYAGKSFFRCHISYLHKDHPRLCGEKVDFHKFIFHKLGSPPPMRGKVKKSIQAAFGKRITPAYAGKSRYLASFERGCMDHQCH